jgi:hypothetical protein
LIFFPDVLLSDGLLVLSDGGGDRVAFRASEVVLVEVDEGGRTLIWLRGMDKAQGGVAVGESADEVIRWWARALGMEASGAGQKQDDGRDA